MKLKKSSKNNTEIAKMFQLSLSTVMKYMSMEEPVVVSSSHKLASYIPRIKELFLGGYLYIEIFYLLKKKRCSGGISLYNSKMKEIRGEVSQKIHYIIYKKVIIWKAREHF